MSGSQIVHTVCMDTRDATQTEEGAFHMRLGGDNPRFQAIKVALGSLELPIVQWTIEEAWQRLYYTEGYRFTADDNWLRIVEESDDESNEILVQVPMHLNEIVDMQPLGDRVRVRCQYPHGLWVDARRSVLPAIDWGDVEIICSPLGRMSLSHAFETGKLTYLNENEFTIDAASFGDAADGAWGFVHAPPIPSPHHLCLVLSYGLQFSNALASYKIEYDARANRAELVATMYPVESKRLTVRLFGSSLARILGYPSSVHERRFARHARPVDGAPPLPTAGFREEVTAHDEPPLRLPSEAFSGWSFAALEPGWYAPAHRPMCTGQPLRLTQEIELALTRLYFAIPERVPQGLTTAHFLMFSDPSGTMHNCPVYPGRYTGESFARLLETEMTRISSMPGTTYTVEYDAEEERFVFLCEVRGEHGVRPAPFSLLLHHPAQFDPARIGFEPVALHGSDTYVSSKRVRVPSSLTNAPYRRPPSNVYRVSEIGHQKRMRVQSTPLPQLTGLIVHYDEAKSILRVRTYAGELPFAHGLLPGDVVDVAPVSSGDLFIFNPEDGAWESRSFRRAPIAPQYGRSGVVVGADGSDRGSPMPGFEHVDLFVRVKPTPRLGDCVDQLVGINVPVQPFNLCFGLPRSISSRQLGFDEGATQWGIDGSARSSRFRLPPFDAPRVHALDHPDYILIYLEEAKMSTGLQHRYGRNTTTPFAKLVLYPMFREERMLPRDSTLLSGESLSTFTLRFTNPDGSPYHFHGAQFSFSLNFIKVADG